MNENEFNLKRENLQLRIALAKSEAQVLQLAHDKALVELQAMGEKYIAEEVPLAVVK